MFLKKTPSENHHTENDSYMYIEENYGSYARFVGYSGRSVTEKSTTAPY